MAARHSSGKSALETRRAEVPGGFSESPLSKMPLNIRVEHVKGRVKDEFDSVPEDAIDKSLAESQAHRKKGNYSYASGYEHEAVETYRLKQQ